MIQGVGCRVVGVRGAVQDAVIVSSFLYPAAGVQNTLHFGAYEIDAVADAPVQGRSLPLVIVSHGDGGSPWTHRCLALHLARAGFVVCLLKHPASSVGDNSLAGTAANLRNRPRHVSLAIDAAFMDPELGPHLAPDRAAVVGHSISGATALAVAGGRPWARVHEMGADATEAGSPRPVEVPADARVRVLVLLAPATPWFLPEGSRASTTR